MNALVTENLGLVWHLARKLSRTGELREELVSIGYLALVECAQRLDASKGAKFASYAHHRVKGAMLDELRRVYLRPFPTEDHALAEAVEARQLPDDSTESRLAVHEALLTLSERDRAFLVGEMIGSTAKDTGADLDMSRSWASRVRHVALARAAEALTLKP